MEKLVIQGKSKLEGEVKVSGSKNASLPILAASILSSSSVRLKNVPHLRDVSSMLQALGYLGVDITLHENYDLELNSENIKYARINNHIIKSMRASVLLMGPMLVRFKKVSFYTPGGCSIGERPINLHLDALKKMGAIVKESKDSFEISCSELKAADITFDKITVTGTENLLMTAVLVEGTTILRNVAKEPEVGDLARFLNKMGANIIGIDTDTLIIKGVKKLGSCQYKLIGDRIEAGTYLAAAIATKSMITVSGFEPAHMLSVLDAFRSMGTELTIGETSVTVDARGKKIKGINLETSEYPGLPTDMQAQFVLLNVLAEKEETIVQENIFENRFMHAVELKKMGAKIDINDHFLKITPVKSLTGCPVLATDLRASACLVLAGLIAEGETTISDIYHLDRGYAAIDEKFHKLGAKIKRIISK